ncbi:MAG TPA: RDD family protein [Streptosporangiaceae bacterium]|jgi:uncharacterized RDD family membrane protein YckC
MDQRARAGGRLPPLAGRARRVCARLVDLVIGFGAGGAIVALCEPLIGAGGPVVAAGWLVPPLYEIVGSITGGTLGKRVFGLRIASARDPVSAPSAGALTARALTMLPLMAIWFVNLLVMVTDRVAGRAIHDAIAGTVVCRTSATGYGVDAGYQAVGPRERAPGLAHPGVRIAARGVDLLVCAVLGSAAATAVGGAGRAAVAAALLLTGPVYELACACAGGTTLGKLLFRLRVRQVAAPGRAPLRRLAPRALVLWGLALVPCLAGVVCDLMIMWRDPSHRAAHDLGRTTVCRADATGYATVGPAPSPA